MKKYFISIFLILTLFSNNVICEPNNILAAPEDITLKGNIREETVNSSLGEVKLRWPRKVEMLFGRNPLRATIEALRVVSKVVKTSGFPSKIQRLNIDWKIIFLDENLPSTQIPHNLISNCHPGWMTPPSNIYIVSQRVAGDCGGKKTKLHSKSIADSDLSEVLIHEIGHAIEYQILKNMFSSDRARAEGFATWFGRYASKYSSMISSSKLKKKDYLLAKTHIKKFPNKFIFDGSAYSYARASMVQDALVNKYGIRGLMKVYKRMRKEKIMFKDAIKKEYGWDKKRLKSEINNLLK